MADLVWMFTPKVPKGQAKKLKLWWKGPYRVTEIRSPLVYVLQHQHNPKDVQVTHISRLKPHRGGDTLTGINEMLKYTYPLDKEETGVQDVQESEQKEIEAVIAHRPDKEGKYEFRVRYRGFTARHNAWVDEKDMQAETLLQCYWQALNLCCGTQSRHKGKLG